MMDMTVLTEAQDLDSIISFFSRDRRFPSIFLWGASQGGFVSAYSAARHPDEIRAMVLEFPAIVLQDDARARAFADGSFPGSSTIMGITVSHLYNEAAVSFDLFDFLPGYPGDVLIQHGDQDSIVPLSYSEKAAAVFPSAKLSVFPGQGHVFHGSARDQAMKESAEFFLSHTL